MSISKHIFVTSILLFLINCKSNIDKTILENKSGQMNRVWMLIEFKDFEKEKLINAKAQINLKDSKNYNASMGCNNIGFKMQLNENNIKFLELIATEMACGDKMKLENAFMTSLPSINQFKIQGHQLILSNSQNEKMVFVAQDWD